MTDNDREKLRKLAQQVSSLETEVRDMARAMPGPADDESRGRAVKDAMWKCVKCNSLLAFYDEKEDLLRIRYKDHITFVRLGAGGHVTIVCRGCGQPCTQEHVTDEELEKARAEEKQTAAG